MLKFCEVKRAVKKQKKWKRLSKLNSFILTTIFIFSSLFALTGCSTSNIYAGIVYNQKGYDYIVDNISYAILEDLYKEYGMANKTVSGGNNWGSLDFESLFDYTGDYSDSDEKTIADDLSNFSYFYYKKVDNQYIIICSTRYLTSVELGDGDNNGMIVGYDSGQFYMRNRNTDGSLNYGNLSLISYHPVNVDVTSLTTNTKLPFNFVLTVDPDQEVASNSAYKFFVENQPSNSSFSPFTAYVFVGQTVGETSLSEPVSFLENFYSGSHVNAIERDLSYFDDPFATPTTSWGNLTITSEVWNRHLNETELDNNTTFAKRKVVFAEKYNEYLAMLIIKNILVGSSDLSTFGSQGATLKSKYGTAMTVVENYIDAVSSVTHDNAVTAVKVFLDYVTTLGVDLYYDANDTTYVSYSILSELIGSDVLTLNSSSSTATEKLNSTSPFFKNYESKVGSIVTSHIGNSNVSASAQSLLKGYELEKDGFTDEIVCSLSSIFFCNANVLEDIFTSVNKNLPDFTIFFEADEENLAKLKNYDFYLYYHRKGDLKLADLVSENKGYLLSSCENLIKINIDKEDENDEFLGNLDDGIIYVDVYNIFYMSGITKDNPVELNNFTSLGDDPLDNGFLSSIVFNKNAELSVNIFDSDGSSDIGSFDLVELILVPPSSSSVATITITDIMI